MAKNVVIRDIVYSNVPSVQIPLSPGPGEAEFFDISDATLDSGGSMLSGVTAYGADGTKYTGSIVSKGSADLSVSGATVTAPAGYYESSASASVASGSATTPATSITANPTISVNSSTGLITASVSETQSVTPSVSAGYVTAGTAGTITVAGSDTEQLTTKAATTYHPSSTAQTIASSTYLTGTQTINAVVVTNLLQAYIAKDVTVKVGDSSDDDCVMAVTGTLDAPIVSQDASTKVLSIS